MKTEIDVTKALQEDEAFKEADTEFERMTEIAQSASEEITSSLVQEIVRTDETGKKAGELTLTTAIQACMRASVNLCGYLYDKEEDFCDSIVSARKEIVEHVVPSILDPKPCGKCEACREGKPCINPDMNTRMLQSKMTPLLACSLYEYDLWNKVVYAHTPEGKTVIESMSNQDEEKEEK